MISHGQSGKSAAFDARSLAGVLGENDALMARFKEAAAAGSVKAVRGNNRNFTVVGDDELAREIRDAAPDLHVYSYDAASGEIAR